MRAPNYLFPVGHLIANFRKSIARLPLAWTDDGRVVCPATLESTQLLTFMTTQTDSAVVFKKPQSFANWEGYTRKIPNWKGKIRMTQWKPYFWPLLSQSRELAIVVFQNLWQHKSFSLTILTGNSRGKAFPAFPRGVFPWNRRKSWKWRDLRVEILRW